jgi:hypothetical protein
LEASRDGILILDADTGKVVDANPYLLGKKAEDAFGLCRLPGLRGGGRSRSVKKLNFARHEFTLLETNGK